MKSFNKSAVLALIFVAGGAIAPAHANNLKFAAAGFISGAASKAVYLICANDKNSSWLASLSPTAKDSLPLLTFVAALQNLWSAPGAAAFTGATKGDQRDTVNFFDALGTGCALGGFAYVNSPNTALNFAIPAITGTITAFIWNSVITPDNNSRTTIRNGIISRS